MLRTPTAKSSWRIEPLGSLRKSKNGIEVKMGSSTYFTIFETQKW